jgi:hypothetical protein
MKIEIGDLIVVNGQVWTVIQKSRNFPLILQNRDRKIHMYVYEIQRWLKRDKDSKHYSVIK